MQAQGGVLDFVQTRGKQKGVPGVQLGELPHMEAGPRTLYGGLGIQRLSKLDPNTQSTSPTASTMSYPPGMPPPPPGMPMRPPLGLPMPPPGMPHSGMGQASGSRMPPEMLAQKSQKWIQMQKKRYGEKRKGGFVDMGKQVGTLSL